MLKEQVASVVEATLARTRPGRAFTIAVLAALPGAAPQVAAAAAVATSGQESAAAHGAASASLAGAVLGPILGVAGAYVGAKASLDATRSPRERAFVRRSIFVFTAYALVFLLVELVGLLAAPRTFGTLPVQIAVVGAYTAGLVAMILRHNRRQRQVQVEDGTYVDPASLPPPDLSRVSRGAVYGAFGGGIFGGTLWILPMSWIAGEPLFGVAVMAFAVVLFIVLTQRALRHPAQFFRLEFLAVAILAVVNTVVINLRWEPWMAAYRRSPFYSPGSDLPLWAMNVLLAALFGWLLLHSGRLAFRHGRR
jgi:Ca2+/H+ antiporter